MQNKPSTVVEYIWLGANNEIRSKTRVLYDLISNDIEEIPVWNFDGSSTNQAAGNESELIIKPQKIFMDPFKKPKSLSNSLFLIAVCDVYNVDGTHHNTNTRFLANQIFNKKIEEHPWFGIEQEYTMMMMDGVTPLGWPKTGYPEPQGKYYCGNGTGKVVGRCIVDEHYNACLYAGINISGTNAEVMLGQWEYQVGPTCGIKAADDLWLSRFLLHRVAEKHNVIISFDAKPVKGDWNGSGCHTNYSTKSMREIKDNYKTVINDLSKRHREHLQFYGRDNDQRLTGTHETSSMDSFTWGVADRGSSVRVPRETAANGIGYIEDRRPSSLMDPYLVTGVLVETTISTV